MGCLLGPSSLNDPCVLLDSFCWMMFQQQPLCFVRLFLLMMFWFWIDLFMKTMKDGGVWGTGHLLIFVGIVVPTDFKTSLQTVYYNICHTQN